MKKRKIYSKEFKLEALRQWEQGGQSARAVASSLSLPSYGPRSDLVGTDISSGAEPGRHDRQHESIREIVGIMPCRISFFGQLKNEWTYGQDYPDRDQAEPLCTNILNCFTMISDYIRLWVISHPWNMRKPKESLNTTVHQSQYTSGPPWLSENHCNRLPDRHRGLSLRQNVTPDMRMFLRKIIVGTILPWLSGASHAPHFVIPAEAGAMVR